MIEVFDYLDYREFLRDRYLESQVGDGKFTHRSIGEKGGFDPGLFSKVIMGQRNISGKLIPGFCKAFALEGRQAAYFGRLVLFNQAKTFGKKKSLFEKLLSDAGGRMVPVARGQYEFYREWHHTAIRELLNYHPFKGDFKDLGRQLHPPVSAAKARQSVALLEKLGFIRKGKGKDGTYELASPQITTGNDTRSVAVDNFILQGLELAKSGLKKIPANRRNFSTLTFSVPGNRIADLEERLRAFRRELAEWVRKAGGQDSVYQLNMQLFPLTVPKKGKGNV
jgi:uncharacterized protein (TIGR02147 family)